MKRHEDSASLYGGSCTVPPVRRGLHDEVQVVPALPPAAGVSEVHLLSILRHRQVIDERQLPASDHLTT